MVQSTNTNDYFTREDLAKIYPEYSLVELIPYDDANITNLKELTNELVDLSKLAEVPVPKPAIVEFIHSDNDFQRKTVYIACFCIPEEAHRFTQYINNNHLDPFEKAEMPWDLIVGALPKLPYN